MEFKEVTIQELADMLQRGEISAVQYSNILIKEMGREKFMEIYNNSIKEYFKDFSFEKKEEPK